MRANGDQHEPREAQEGDTTLVRISRAKSEWESTVDSLPDLVFLVSTDRRILRANRTIESWGLGSVRVIQGKDLHEILHPGCLEGSCEVLRLWSAIGARRDTSVSLESDFRDSLLGRRVDLSMHRSDAGRDRAAITVVVRDRSELYDQEQVRLRKDRLDTMEYVLGGLAHEVGNPIAAMKTTLDVWRRSFDRFDRETHERYLTRVEEGLDRLRASVDRVLAGHEKSAARREPVSISSLFERVRSLFADQAAEAGIDLAAELRVDTDEAVLGDPRALDDILANVVKNALEACMRGAGVSIRAHVQGPEAIMTIEDSGAGIGPEEMDRLFVPFYTSKPSGTGLGLTLANQLIQQMGGRIDLESTEGVGTIAVLRLPRAPRESRAT